MLLLLVQQLLDTYCMPRAEPGGGGLQGIREKRLLAWLECS